MKDKTKLVKQHFKKTEQYLINNYVIRIRKEVVADFLKDKSFSNIIDIACGNAEISRQFLTNDNHLTLVDISEQMLTNAKGNIPKEFLKSVSFVCSDFDKSDLPYSSFDLVICTGLLAHVNNIPDTISKLVRLAKPGGFLIIQNTSSSHPFSWIINSREWLKWRLGYSRYLYNVITYRRLENIFSKENLYLFSSYRSIVSFFVFGRIIDSDTKYRFIKWLFGSSKSKRFQSLGNDYIYCLKKENN